jgi:hypothetical protein
MARKLKETAVAELAVRRLRGESLDKLADELVMISDAVKKLRNSRITENTLLLLIQDAIGSGQHTKYRQVPLKVIKAILDGMDQLATKHLKPREKK